MRKPRPCGRRTPIRAAGAYQEIFELHKAHIGTGSKTVVRDDTGLNAFDYRRDRRRFIDGGDVSSAVLPPQPRIP
jgi:hypothetical protein